MLYKEALRLAESVLKQGLEGCSYSSSGNDIPGGPDLHVEAQGCHFAIEVKALHSSRTLHLEGQLAVAVLQIRDYARVNNCGALVMVKLPKLGRKTIAFAADFMERHAREVGWCLFDESGSFHLVVPTLHVAASHSGPRSTHPEHDPVRGALFSDLNRWMLKLLLMSDVSAQYWGGPRQHVGTARDLRELAGVSNEKAYSFLRVFHKLGYVRESNGRFIITRHSELIRTWLNHELAFQSGGIPVRSLRGHSLEVLASRDGPEPVAVTGFEACRILGVLHAPVPRREVLVHGQIGTALKAWDCHRCDPRDADFIVKRMSNPKSVLRGRVVRDNLPVVDVLEAALSVFGQMPRGTEQAEYIVAKVLCWSERD